VFSDVDETLIGCRSPWEFLLFYYGERYGPPGARWARAVRDELGARVRGGMPRGEANRAYFRCWAGEPVGAVRDSGERWYARAAARPGFFHARTREELAAHQARGAELVLVSGSSPAVLAPVARAVGAAQVLCARPAVRDGVFTGDLLGGPMIGPAKRAAVREALRTRPHTHPQDCFAYGDHISDLPMLTEVGHPVLVITSTNASPDLGACANASPDLSDGVSPSPSAVAAASLDLGVSTDDGPNPSPSASVDTRLDLGVSTDDGASRSPGANACPGPSDGVSPSFGADDGPDLSPSGELIRQLPQVRLLLVLTPTEGVT
jgi:HAD superfamily hydrolase (TIGR01490 family)